MVKPMLCRVSMQCFVNGSSSFLVVLQWFSVVVSQCFLVVLEFCSLMFDVMFALTKIGFLS